MPSTTYGEYDILRVLYTPSTSYDEFSMHLPLHHLKINGILLAASISALNPHLPASVVVLNCLHLHNYMLTAENSLSTRCTFCQTYFLQIKDLQILVKSQSVMASMWIFHLVQSQFESLHTDGLPVCTILASMDIPKVTWSWPPSSHNHGLHVGIITVPTCFSTLARSKLPSASPNFPSHGIILYQQDHYIMALKWVTTETWLSCSISHKHGDQVSLQTCSILSSMFPPSWPWSWLPRLDDHVFKGHLLVLGIGISRCSFNFSQILSGARLKTFIYRK